MEDIDKNGDGLIDLDEYIGEFIQPIVIQASSVCTTRFCVIISDKPRLVENRWKLWVFVNVFGISLSNAGETKFFG